MAEKPENEIDIELQREVNRVRDAAISKKKCLLQEMM